jgi:hypothetical protein
MKANIPYITSDMRSDLLKLRPLHITEPFGEMPSAFHEQWLNAIETAPSHCSVRYLQTEK